MPLERHIDDLTACDGIKFWMSDGERPVLCRVSHEALRDLAERVHFEGTDEKVFEAYRASFSSLPRRSPEWAAAHERHPPRYLKATLSTPALGACRWRAFRARATNSDTVIGGADRIFL
jgi:hypothetical protein